MNNRGYKRTMHKEQAKGNRNCILCDEPIKRKQFCYTVVVGGRQWPIRLHIHKSHIKPFNPSKCKNKMECITNQHHYCTSVLCKNRRY